MCQTLAFKVRIEGWSSSFIKSRLSVCVHMHKCVRERFQTEGVVSVKNPKWGVPRWSSLSLKRGCNHLLSHSKPTSGAKRRCYQWKRVATFLRVSAQCHFPQRTGPDSSGPTMLLRTPVMRIWAKQGYNIAVVPGEACPQASWAH